MRVLVTGGAGFVGTHLLELLLRHPDVGAITVVDNYRHTAVPAAGPASCRIQRIEGDVRDQELINGLVEDCDAVIHLAAETFVDASIADGRPFIDTNVLGTATVVQALRHSDPRPRLVQVSTDEVFGQASAAPFTEDSPYRPRNPYSASKAAADHLARAWALTYGLDVRIVHCGNLFGRWQYPEKLIPVTVSRLLHGHPAQVYGNGRQSRTWLHVTDAAAGILAALDHGMSGQSYLIAGEEERSTLEMVHRIAELVGVADVAAVVRFVADRPGHDQRYAIDTSKARRDLGWKPEVPFDAGLTDTVRWMIDNDRWWL